jgi:hypothetical protein
VIKRILEDRRLFYDYRNIKVYYGYREGDQDHFSRNMKIRFPEYDLTYFKMLLRKLLDKINKEIKNGGENKKIIAIDAKSSIKFPISVEYNRDDKPIIVFTTILDKNKQQINTGLEEILYIND